MNEGNPADAALRRNRRRPGLLGLWAAALLCAACRPALIVPAPDAAATAPAEATRPALVYAPGCRADGNVAVVHTDRLRVRAAPSFEASILRVVVRADEFPVLDSETAVDWVRIQLPDSSAAAWVFRSLIQFAPCQPLDAAMVADRASAASSATALTSAEACPPGQQAAVIQADRLRVRAAPNAEASILGTVTRDETYPAVEQTENGAWIRILRAGDARASWVFGSLVRLACLTRANQVVARRTVAQLWSRGELFSGIAYAVEATPAFTQPDAAAPVAYAVDAGSWVVASAIRENGQGERWARIQPTHAYAAGAWVPADRLAPAPDTLLERAADDSLVLGTRLFVQGYAQALEALKEFPAGSGGRRYDRTAYAPVPAADACDAACAALQAAQRADGSWFLRYENRMTRDRSAVRAEPLLPFFEVHNSEGWLWDEEQRARFRDGSREPAQWAIISQRMKQARGAADPAAWLPAERHGRCRYAMDWISAKGRWDLAVDKAEKRVLADVLATCDDSSLAVTASAEDRADEAPSVPGFRLALRCNARTELVTIVNRGAATVNLEGWHLHDAGNENRFRLPRWALQAGASVSLATGDAQGDIQLSATPAWNNDGDTGFLYDAGFHLVAARACETP